MNSHTRSGRIGAQLKTVPAGNRDLTNTLQFKENVMATDKHSGSTSVYKYYDLNDLLLYVGITSRGSQRQSEHNATKEWWRFVSRQEVEHYTMRAAAAERERALIQTFRPPFNVVYNPDHERTRTAYLALATKGGISARNIYPSLIRPDGKNRYAMDLERLGNTLILRSLPENASVLTRVDVAYRNNIVVSCQGARSLKAAIDSIYIKRDQLVAIVHARRNAEQVYGAQIMLRNSDKTQHDRVSIKRIDFYAAGTAVQGTTLAGGQL